MPPPNSWSDGPLWHLESHLPSPPASLYDYGRGIERRELPVLHARKPLTVRRGSVSIGGSSSRGKDRRSASTGAGGYAVDPPRTTGESSTALVSSRSGRKDQARVDGSPKRRRQPEDCAQDKPGDHSSSDEETDWNGTRRLKRSRLEPSSSRHRGRRWACPLFKFDPDGESRCSLELPGFSSPSQVRQHLLSRHNPLNKCPRCRECFSDENGDFKSQIEFHLRLKICVEAPTREKYILSEHAIKELENETPPRNPVDFWYSLARFAVPYVRNDPIASLKEMFTPWVEPEILESGDISPSVFSEHLVVEDQQAARSNLLTDKHQAYIASPESTSHQVMDSWQTAPPWTDGVNGQHPQNQSTVKSNSQSDYFMRSPHWAGLDQCLSPPRTPDSNL